MPKIRYEIKIKGLVQGIGFRPFIYKLAQQLHLKGWVKNSAQGVIIEVESSLNQLKIFTQKIQQEKPKQADIYNLEIKQLNYIGYQRFTIEKSEAKNHHTTTIISTDLATCSECLQELFNPQDRRYRYPFINCINCGPRYSIIKALPYDRIMTTMNQFTMCSECQQEYDQPINRRFHAQPNACPKCGPDLELWDQKGNCLAKFDDTITKTIALIKAGNILAIKGLGGFHVIVDGGNNSAVRKLRLRKNRPYKPFAVMYPNLEQIKQDCFVSLLEEKTLLSSASPIVLLTRIKTNNTSVICEQIAPKNPYLGVMLPYTPLHHLLLNELKSPLVATSGNRQNEPICIDERDALARLDGIADYFLVHNRPILLPVDDSIVRIIDDQVMIIRRARGYAPLPIHLPHKPKQNYQKILALGGQLKNTVAIKINQQVFLSQHLGNLETEQTLKSYQQTITHLQDIYNFRPNLIACDAHPDYYTSRYAQDLQDNDQRSLPIIKVQHHLAHIFSVIAEHDVKYPLLGIAWDGTGYGLDRTIWGGEFFYLTEDRIQRIASFLPFYLLGGNKAIVEPKRIALSLLLQIFNNRENIPEIIPFISSFSTQELKIFTKMYQNKINSPLTSSVGRLFDGVAALLGIVEQVTYEGEAAMRLEFTADEMSTTQTYPFDWNYREDSCSYIDWKPMLKNIIDDYVNHESLALISAKFHQTLVEIITIIATSLSIENIILAGGCFQNKYLLEQTINRLTKSNLHPHWSQKIPINDGGLALGQITFASQYPNITKIQFD